MPDTSFDTLTVAPQTSLRRGDYWLPVDLRGVIDFSGVPPVHVTYYAGEWSKEDRAEVRRALEAAGFEVEEDDGVVKGW